jgi:hypothetical protein
VTWLVLLGLGLLGLSLSGRRTQRVATFVPEEIAGGMIRAIPAARRRKLRELGIDFEGGEPIPNDPQYWTAGAACANPDQARIYNGLLCARWPGYKRPIWVRIFKGSRVGGDGGELPSEITDLLWGRATKDANGNWVFADKYTGRWEAFGKGKACSPELEHQTAVGFWDANDPGTGAYASDGPHERVCFGKDNTKWHDPDAFSKCSSKTAAIVAAPWMAGGELGYELHHRYCKPYDGPKNT